MHVRPSHGVYDVTIRSTGVTICGIVTLWEGSDVTKRMLSVSARTEPGDVAR